MADIAFENAKALKVKANFEISRLEDELRLWRDRLFMADQFLDQWNAFALGKILPNAETVSYEENKTGSSNSARKSIRNSKKEDVAAAALGIISERGRPVPRTELYEALIQRGLTINGTDPEMVLSTMLWRMKALIVRLPGGYWDCKRDWAPSGYKSEFLDDIEGRERDYSGVDLTGALIK